MSEDFDTYRIKRVGLVPFGGAELDAEGDLALQDAFLSEMSRSAHFEIVRLAGADVDEIPGSEPYRRGWYKPATIIDLAARYKLDGLLVGTVTQRHPYPPQSLGVELDLVAAETGLVVWHGSIFLDATDDRVRRSLEEYYRSRNAAAGTKESAALTLLSPRRFAHFAAHHLAQLL